ncbi:MAG: hypothetical protein LJE62_01630 [Silicimonas sp.]|nr:hypothetical protein [Silicimonas sp.]
MFEDALTGIRVGYGDGSYSIVTRDPSGAVRETEYSGDDVVDYVAEGGLLETAYRDRADGAWEFFEYSFDTTSLVPPTPWSSASGEQVSRDEAGNETHRVPFSIHMRGRTSYRIGDCVYDGIGVQTYYRNPEETSLVEFVYLIDLGLPLVVGFGGPGYFDGRRPVSISKETP